MKCKLNDAYLELFIYVVGSGDQRSRHLHDVHVSTGEPGPLQFGQKGLFDDKSTDACRKSEHFIERDGHCVESWIVGEKYCRTGGKGSGI